eukprot:8081336-Lingulodinium_polyedra.AAC.1
MPCSKRATALLRTSSRVQANIYATQFMASAAAPKPGKYIALPARGRLKTGESQDPATTPRN